MILDAKGLACPKPVILTKNELDKMEQGQLIVIVDNAVAVANLQKLAASLNIETTSETTCDTEYKVIFNKTKENIQQAKKEEVANEDLTIIFASDKMGDGDEELGKILIKSFVYTVSETKPLPKSMVFYNKGVYLTVEGSSVIDDLKKLEEQGVEIISCGTCLDFYQIKEKLQVGTISNMYTIYEKMAQPTRNVMIR